MTTDVMTKEWSKLYHCEAKELVDNLTDTLHEQYHKRADYVGTYCNWDTKVYIAGPWFKAKDRHLMDVFYTYFRKIYPHSYFPLYDQQITDTPRDSYYNNINAIDKCDTLVALISTFDTGTAYEIGYANALDKKIILLCWNELDLKNHGTNLMLALCSDAVYKVSDFLQHVIISSKIDICSVDNDDIRIQVNNDWRNVI